MPEFLETLMMLVYSILSFQLLEQHKYTEKRFQIKQHNQRVDHLIKAILLYALQQHWNIILKDWKSCADSAFTISLIMASFLVLSNFILLYTFKISITLALKYTFTQSNFDLHVPLVNI